MTPQPTLTGIIVPNLVRNELRTLRSSVFGFSFWFLVCLSACFAFCQAELFGALVFFPVFLVVTALMAFLITEAGDAQLAARYPDFFQGIEGFVWHADRQVDEAVIVMDIDAAYMLAADIRFIGNCADDVAGHNAVVVANCNPVALHTFRRWSIVFPVLGWPSAGSCCAFFPVRKCAIFTSAFPVTRAAFLFAPGLVSFSMRFVL